MKAVLVISIMALAAIGNAPAQNYPARTIRLVVPTAPGGGSDILARLLAQKLSESFGQQIVADNRAGASNTLGIALVARAAPDGYTLAITPASLAINPSMFKQLPYDTLRDLAPVSGIAHGPLVLFVHPSVPARNVTQLIAIAKSSSDKLMVGTAGLGTLPYLAAELFNLRAGTKMPQVLYKGSGQALLSVLTGEVAVGYTSPISVISYAAAGKLRPLGVTSKARLEALRDVPAIGETLSGYDATNWYGIVAPAATPRAIVERLHQEIGRALRARDMSDRLHGGGFETLEIGPDEFGRMIKSEMEKWAAVIKAAGIKPE